MAGIVTGFDEGGDYRVFHGRQHIGEQLRVSAKRGPHGHDRTEVEPDRLATRRNP